MSNALRGIRRVESTSNSEGPARRVITAFVSTAVAIAVVAGGVAAFARSAQAAESVASWCSRVVSETIATVPPVATRLGGQVTLHVATNAAERASLVERFALDSTGLTLASRRGNGPFQIDLVIDCVAVISTQQLTPLRFLVMHELAHVMQFMFQADPLAQTRDDHEHEADCAANALMRRVYSNPLPLSYGAHGGCTPSRFEPTTAWVASLMERVEVASSPPTPGTNRTRGMKAWAGPDTFARAVIPTN